MDTSRIIEFVIFSQILGINCRHDEWEEENNYKSVNANDSLQLQLQKELLIVPPNIFVKQKILLKNVYTKFEDYFIT